jgi:hypothetical protein
MMSMNQLQISFHLTAGNAGTGSSWRLKGWLSEIARNAVLTHWNKRTQFLLWEHKWPFWQRRISN